MEKTPTIADALKQREFLSVLIIVVNSFSWYFPLYLLFGNNIQQSFLLTAFGAQLAAVIGSAFVGIMVAKKFSNRSIFLSVWMLVGIMVSPLLIVLETSNLPIILIISVLVGISLGLGFPSCLAFFGDHSTIHNRGFLGGITFFASGLSILAVGLILSVSTLFVGALILAAWRGLGLLLFVFSRSKQYYPKEKLVESPYREILFDKSFLFYLIPWIMFCVVNFLGVPIEIRVFGEELGSYMPILEYGVGGFIALIGGWLADTVGRKRIIIVGFIMLGIGFAVLGLSPNNSLSWYLYISIDSVAWGIFSLMFYLVLWSELTRNRNKTKFYLIGILPFLIASYIQLVFTPFAELVDATQAFSLASFFLFMSVLPLLYAPETIPQKQIELKRLRKFADEAKKAKEKYERMGL